MKTKNKEQYLKEVEEIANEEIQILDHHLSRCFKRFAEKVFKLNKLNEKFIGENLKDEK